MKLSQVEPQVYCSKQLRIIQHSRNLLELTKNPVVSLHKKQENDLSHQC